MLPTPQLAPGVPQPDCWVPPAECSQLYLSWSPGVDVNALPADVGFPMGQGAMSHVLLQVGAWGLRLV